MPKCWKRTILFSSAVLFLLGIVRPASAQEKPTAPKAVAPGTVTLDFARKAQPGDRFLYRIHTNRSQDYKFEIVGLSKPLFRRETVTFLAAGELTYKACDFSGAERKVTLSFKIARLSGTLNGRKFDFPELAGRTVTAVFSGNTSEITMDPSTAYETSEREAQSVLSGGSGSSGPDKPDAELHAAAMIFLKNALVLPDESFALFLGETKKVSPGDRWTPDKTPFLEMLRERQIPAGEKSISALASYAGTTLFQGISAARVTTLYQGRNITGYDFKFDLSILFPLDKSVRLPLRITRDAMEVVNPSMIFDALNPFAAGTRIELIQHDRSDLILLPWDQKVRDEGAWINIL